MSKRRHLERREKRYNEGGKSFVGWVPRDGGFLRYTPNPIDAEALSYQAAKRRKNTYYPEAINDWMYHGRPDVVFFGKGTQKFIRMGAGVVG